MEVIYIIEGNTGEYSDRTNWLVMAFNDLSKANDFLNDLTLKLVELKLSQGFSTDWEEREIASEQMKNLDPQFCCDYTGTHYTLLTVELSQ